MNLLNNSYVHGFLVAAAILALHTLQTALPALSGFLGPAAPFAVSALSGLFASLLHYLQPDDTTKP